MDLGNTFTGMIYGGQSISQLQNAGTPADFRFPLSRGMMITERRGDLTGQPPLLKQICAQLRMIKT